MKLLKIAIIGFLKSSLIAALLKLCLLHLCTNWYSSSQKNRDNRSISMLTISKYLLLIGLPSSRLSNCGVPSICVRTGGWFDPTQAFHCQLPYRRNHCRKGDEMDLNAVLEYMAVEFHGAWLQNYHLEVDRPIHIQSFLSGCQGGERWKRWCSSTTSSSKNTIGEHAWFSSKMKGLNNVKKHFDNFLATHTITIWLNLGNSHTFNCFFQKGVLCYGGA